MQNKRDHVQAYQFATGRLGAALVTGDPGTGEAPLRRTALGTFLGVLAAALLCGGCAVYGLIRPGGDGSWRKPGSLIVEKETGNRYLFLDGTLRPTANYASALLVLEHGATVRTVSRHSLAGVPHGPAVGLPGAPDTLPGTGDLLAGEWTWCASGAASTLALGPAAPGPAAGTAPPKNARVLLRSASSGKEYVLWHHTRHPVTARSVVVALGLDVRPALRVPEAWLASLPLGRALTPAAVRHSGADGPPVGGSPAEVGSLFRSTAGGAERTYVLLDDGLAPVTATEAALLAALPGHREPALLDAALLAAAPVSANRSLLTRLPDLLRDGTVLDTGDAPLCLRQTARGAAVRSTVVLGTPAQRPSAEAASAPEATVRITVPNGSGMLATPYPAAPGTRRPERHLITDRGVRHRLADDRAASALGYAGAPAVAVPRSVLALLPAGPVLDTEAARTTSAPRVPAAAADGKRR
ncbi:type VII secretion protein EccB [Streptomyces sp. NPDC096068]|uniref:type VII secretion protein EccB n=1 Tax=Streptomyces sp. NPDC096068 TaxID=3155424 RepID=UPI003317FDED